MIPLCLDFKQSMNTISKIKVAQKNTLTTNGNEMGHFETGACGSIHLLDQ